ncbi:MAG: hypothetical protein OEZ14_03990 [Acidimicrobiia bacterium]|nr:hypothetical protein [Acidimicrobiia bacterium]MDH5519678.1 hypothetical protein [Acidimicrobiia bacterium]
MSDVETVASLDLRGKTITTFILYEAHHALQDTAVGDWIELVTDAFPAIDPDIAAWCRTTGNPLIDVVVDGDTRRYVIENGPQRRSGHKLAAVISDDGLFELLSPLGFALAAALEGDDVSIYFLGPATRSRDNHLRSWAPSHFAPGISTLIVRCALPRLRS